MRPLLAGRIFFRCWRVLSNLCPPPCAPWWPAGFFSVLAGACQFDTAWAGLRLIHHHQGAFQFGTEHGVGGFATNSSSSRDPILSAGVCSHSYPPPSPPEPRSRPPAPSHTPPGRLWGIFPSRAQFDTSRNKQETHEFFCHSLWRRVPQVATENLVFFNEFVFHRRTCFFWNCCS